MPIKYKKRIDVPINVKIIDPIAPECVLLGLIFVNFGPLKVFPNMYPPISDEIHPIKIIKVITFN